MQDRHHHHHRHEGEANDSVNLSTDKVTSTGGTGGTDGNGGIGREAGREISDIDKRLGELHDFLRRAKAAGGGSSASGNRGGGGGSGDIDGGNTNVKNAGASQGLSQAHEQQQHHQEGKYERQTEGSLSSRCGVDALSTDIGTPPRLLERASDGEQDSLSHRAANHPALAASAASFPQAMPAVSSPLSNGASYADSRGGDNGSAPLSPSGVSGGDGGWDDGDD